MNAVALSRLRGMSRAEVSWRTRQAGRTAAQRLAALVRAPEWNREDVWDVLADGVLDNVSQDDDAGSRWQAVHAELAHLIGKRATRFTLDPRSAHAIRDRVNARWPEAARQAAARGDHVLAGRFDVLGYRLLPWGSPDGAIDWHLDPVSGRRAPLRFWADVPYLDPVIGDHKVVWELNRHQHWLQLGRALWLTGDVRYRRGIIAQLHGWLAANPPLAGINWASMLEIALRAISWTWGLHFLLGHDRHQAPSTKHQAPDSPWLIDLLVALHRQLTHVEQNLSVYFSPNTHLTGEALGLYVVGVALPELANSSRWADTGRRILLEQIGRQIHADGGHAERSTHYQRYTLDFYLMAWLTATRDADKEAAGRFADAARRLAEFTRAMADDRGRLPLIGDDDGGMLWPIGRACHDVRDSLALAAVILDRPDLAPWGLQEEVVWIAGQAAWDARFDVPAGAAAVSSRTLADTGFVVIRDSSGSHATFDVGGHGYLTGGHAHAGALAITLALRGKPLLIDPGTFTYTMHPGLRDRLRSTMSHNTVTLDDRSQAVSAGPFGWRTRADARLHDRRLTDDFDWAEASHTGYAPVRHRRTVVRAARGGWLIADEMLGSGCLTARAHWHFDPGWLPTCDAPGRLRARHVDGDEAWLLHDASDLLLAHGDDESGLGWYAPVYGTLVPAWTVRTTRRTDAPFTLLTWIGDRQTSPFTMPLLERLDPACDADGTAIGARVGDAGGGSVFLLRPGDPAVRDRRACAVLDYRTNARALHYAEAGGRLIALDVIDASHARALRDNWLSITASETIADLHAVLSDDVLDLCSSTPPPELCLDGGALRGMRHVRLNHREIDPPPSARQHTLVIRGGEWNPARRLS
ncbi:MAG: heparinase II/III domain-containing protein [Vicinamibacterales bacterium]